MRIALTGSHRTGKSTLVQALVEASPKLSATIEPYCHHDARYFDFEGWVPRIQESMNTLDLLVYVPIEEPDRVDVPLYPKERSSRNAVDKAIKGLFTSRIFTEMGSIILTVNGPIDDRVQQILMTIDRMRSSP